MIQLMNKIHNILNQMKGFSTGYSSDIVTCEKTGIQAGYMLIDYEDKRYAVKLVEIERPAENPFDDMKQLRYYV